MKTIRSVWLCLLVLFTATTQLAFARDIVLNLDQGQGNPGTTSSGDRIFAISAYVINHGMVQQIQQGDALKVFFTDGWYANYVVSSKTTVNGVTNISFTETSSPATFSITSTGTPGEGESWGCSGGTTVTPVGFWQSYTVVVGGVPAGTGSDWITTGFNIWTQQNCN